MRYRVTRAESWDQVDAAARINSRCIRDGANNNARAKQTWDVFGPSEDCIYFLVHAVAGGTLAGYVRLLCVSSLPSKPRTYVADFISPSLYEPVILTAQALEGSILVKDFSGEDSLLGANWPRFVASWPKLERYPYHNIQIMESTWMVVVK